MNKKLRYPESLQRPVMEQVHQLIEEKTKRYQPAPDTWWIQGTVLSRKGDRPSILLVIFGLLFFLPGLILTIVLTGAHLLSTLVGIFLYSCMALVVSRVVSRLGLAFYSLYRWNGGQHNPAALLALLPFLAPFEAQVLFRWWRAGKPDWSQPKPDYQRSSEAVKWYERADATMLEPFYTFLRTISPSGAAYRVNGSHAELQSLVADLEAHAWTRRSVLVGYENPSWHRADELDRLTERMRDLWQRVHALLPVEKRNGRPRPPPEIPDPPAEVLN